MSHPPFIRRTRAALAATLAGVTLVAVAPVAFAAPMSTVTLVRQGAQAEEQRRDQAVAAIAEAQERHVAQRRTPPGRANATTDVLDDALAKIVGDGAIGVVARVDSPRITWGGAAGLRNKDHRALASQHDRFEVASITKVMTAVLVLQEVEKGTWGLDQRVDDIVPGIFPGHEYVTFRQLLSHTSGIPNGTAELISLATDDASLMAIMSSDYTAQDHIDLVNAAPWSEPGTYFYSNAGFIALGLLLEEQNNKPLAQLMRERVWRTARMQSTTLPADAFERGQMLFEDAWVGGWLDLATFDPDFFLAAGAAMSTTTDLNRLTEAIVTGKLVDKALVEEMMTPVSDFGPMAYGLGFYRLADPCEPGDWLYGHDGATFGTLSMALTSADGTRQVSVGATGRDMTSFDAPRWNYWDVLNPMILASCPG